jgi:hypothetical protein
VESDMVGKGVAKLEDIVKDREALGRYSAMPLSS